MRWMLLVLLVLLAGLQYRLWWGEGSLAHAHALEQQIAEQQSRNRDLQERNRKLTQDVRVLRQGSDAIEEAARSELGWIAPGETFYRIPLDEPR